MTSSVWVIIVSRMIRLAGENWAHEQIQSWAPGLYTETGWEMNTVTNIASEHWVCKHADKSNLEPLLDE